MVDDFTSAGGKAPSKQMIVESLFKEGSELSFLGSFDGQLSKQTLKRVANKIDFM